MTQFISDILEKEGWEGLFEFARKQALLGVIWDDIQDSMDLYGGIPKAVRLKWVAMACKIEELNELTHEVAVNSVNKFSQDGFRSIILKGPGLCHYFPNPLRRQTGDVDIWIWPADVNQAEHNSQKGKEEKIRHRKTERAMLRERRNAIVKYIRGIVPTAKVSYHHVEFKRVQNTEIEVHFTPSWMYSPLKNRILQSYFQQTMENPPQESSGQLPLPSNEFNLVFILIHIFRHLFDEGIGLRQMMDYDMVLRSSSPEDKAAAATVLKRLGLLKFAGAAMYVLREVFSTDESLLLCKPCRKDGEWLMKHIMEGGNFGQHKESGSSRATNVNGRLLHLRNFIRRIRRSSQLIFHYPEEALCAIPWRIWHWCWRWRKGYL